MVTKSAKALTHLALFWHTLTFEVFCFSGYKSWRISGTVSFLFESTNATVRINLQLKLTYALVAQFSPVTVGDIVPNICECN
jgi:hypothetical protein